MSGATLKEKLARYMDPTAFQPVPASVEHTCKTVGKTVHDKRKVRRAIAMERAGAAIRFFRKPGMIEALTKSLPNPPEDI